jgi:hypothetical protein
MAVRKFTYIDFKNAPPAGAMAQATGLAAATTDNTTNVFLAPGGIPLEVRNEQTNSDVVFTYVVDANCTTGWQIPNDNADNDGVEISLGITAETASRYGFKVGTDPAFEFAVKFGIPDVSDYDIAMIGFRKAAAYGDALNDPATTFASAVVYTDVVALNVNAGAIYTIAGKNQTGGGTGTFTATDTTNTWIDDAVKTLAVKVSSAGVVTFTIDGSAPTVNTNTLTLDTGDVMIPFMLFTKGAAVADTPPILATLKAGIQ